MTLHRCSLRVLCVALALSGAVSADEMGLEKYSDRQGRFAISRPPGWTVTFLPNQLLAVTQPALHGARVILLLPHSVPVRSAEELANQATTMLGQGQAQMRPQGKGQQISQAPDTYRLMLKGQFQNVEYRGVLTAVYQPDGTGMYSYYQAPVTGFDQIQPTLLEIINSLWVPGQPEEQASANAIAIQFTEYEDPEGRYTCSIPKGWAVTELPGRVLIVSEDRSQTVCALATQRHPREQKTAKERAEEFIALLSGLAEEVRPIEDGVQISEVPDIFVRTLKVRRGNIVCVGHLTVQRYKDGAVQYYYYQADVERFLDLEPVLCRILSSISAPEEGVK